MTGIDCRNGNRHGPFLVLVLVLAEADFVVPRSWMLK